MKTFKYFLNESFNSPLPWKWVNVSNHAYPTKRAEFDIDEKFFYILQFQQLGISYMEKDEWDLTFALAYIKDENGKHISPKTVYGNTGTGNQMRVFATVIDITKNFINKYKPTIISFSGDKEDKKDSLYRIMIKKFKSFILSMGYKVKERNTKSDTEFSLILK